MKKSKSLYLLQSTVRLQRAIIEKQQKIIDEQRQAPAQKGPVFIGVDPAKNKDVTAIKRFTP